MDYKDYYGILDVDKSANQGDIKRSYRKLARKYHPDVSKEADAEEKFKELNEAYEVLKDPEKRAAYDKLGANWQAGQEFSPPPDWDANFEFSGGGFTSGDASAFSEFFEQMFGGNHAGSGPQHGNNNNYRQPNQQSSQQPIRDCHARIMIDIEDSFNGATKTITLQRPAVDSQGRMATQPHVLNIKIPKGICQGQQIRLKGQAITSNNGQKGDLYLEVSFNPHAIYRINGRDVELDLPIAPWEAALGATIRIPTPAGVVDLKIPASATTDQRLRLKGRGLSGNTAANPGNLTAVLKIIAPPAATPHAKALYRQMQEEMRFNPRSKLGV